jgi:hypothetical protein
MDLDFFGKKLIVIGGTSGIAAAGNDHAAPVIWRPIVRCFSPLNA